MTYLVVKSLHIVFMVTWFAGLFYLPRLFVYHCLTTDAVGSERFKVMERKLFWGIATPGGVLTLMLGMWMWLAWFQGAGLWLYAKVALVAVLVVYHIWCGKLMIDFREERNTRSHVWFRWFNEFPAMILVAVVLLVVVKPE